MRLSLSTVLVLLRNRDPEAADALRGWHWAVPDAALPPSRQSKPVREPRFDTYHTTEGEIAIGYHGDSL